MGKINCGRNLGFSTVVPSKLGSYQIYLYRTWQISLLSRRWAYQQGQAEEVTHFLFHTYYNSLICDPTGEKDETEITELN